LVLTVFFLLFDGGQFNGLLWPFWQHEMNVMMMMIMMTTTMMSRTGIVECLEIIDVGCNLKQFHGLT